MFGRLTAARRELKADAVREVLPPQVDARPTAAPPPADSLPAASRAALVEAARHDLARAAYQSPRAHAERLLRYLQEPDAAWEGAGVLRSSFVQLSYLEFCSEMNLIAFPWQVIGAEFRRLLGGCRTYRSFYDSGRKQSLAVFEIPPARATKIAAPAANDQRVAA